MAFLRMSEARAAAQSARGPLQKSAKVILTEEKPASSYVSRFDVFLSHSYDDAEIILGVKRIIEAMGLTVYVDWIDDAKLDRSQVTKETAAVLRARMKSCNSMVYAHSPNAADSKWMPWELGYFDGYKVSSVWILPLVEEYDFEFSSQEYLGLYPTVDKVGGLLGKVSLGFSNVGGRREPVVLSEAARGLGVFYKTA
jgi:hypothetical protein